MLTSQPLLQRVQPLQPSFTISFVLLLLFMEYSLNYISSLFGNVPDSPSKEHNSDNTTNNNTPGSVLSSDTPSASLIETLSIEKEEKKAINETDLKFNYVNKQLYKLQSLLNQYKTHTKILQLKLDNLQTKCNCSLKNIEAEPENIKTNKDHLHAYEGDAFADVSGNEIDLLYETHQDLYLPNKNSIPAKNIKIEEQNDKIFDSLNEEEYILSYKKSLFDLGKVLIPATFDAIITSIASESLILDYLLGLLIGRRSLKLIQQYIQVTFYKELNGTNWIFNDNMNQLRNEFYNKSNNQYVHFVHCHILESNRLMNGKI